MQAPYGAQRQSDRNDVVDPLNDKVRQRIIVCQHLEFGIKMEDHGGEQAGDQTHHDTRSADSLINDLEHAVLGGGGLAQDKDTRSRVRGQRSIDLIALMLELNHGFVGDEEGDINGKQAEGVIKNHAEIGQKCQIGTKNIVKRDH